MLNRVVLIGRMTRDPESQYTSSGIALAKFGIAVDRFTKNAETGEKEVDFVNIVAWRKTAEFVTQYLGKGRLVAVEGRLQIRNYVAQDGTKRTAAEVVADSVQGLDRAKDGEGGYNASYNNAPAGDEGGAAPTGTPAVGRPAPINADDDPFADE